MVEPQASRFLEAGEHPPQADASSAPPSAAASSDLSDGSCVLLGAPSSGEWLGRELRRLDRYPVQASRPIAARLLDGSGRPHGRWFLADILDISRGGLCLLVSGPLQLPPDQRLLLDVRCHPDFGTLRLDSAVRWCSSSMSFSTLGVAFQETLSRVPRLELERRTVRRDPNTEVWADE